MQQQQNLTLSNHKQLQKDKENNKNNTKKQLLKKKRVSTNSFICRVNLKHIVNINDTWFINEQTLKNPEGSEQNIQRAMFRYKMISKIVLNNSFVGLQLKKVDDNYLPPEYFFQRFRSLGDKSIASIANNLQCIYNSFNELQLDPNENNEMKEEKDEIKLLNQFLNQMQGKMYTIYYVEISKKSINLKNIFFSVPLLQALGWNIKRVACDFLKYRHVFFQIFSPKYYKEYIELCVSNYLKAQQLQKDPTLTREQKIQLTTIHFYDQVVRQVQTQNGVYEQFLKAKVKFTCPHSSFCCVQIQQIYENHLQKKLQKKKKIIQLSSQISSSQELAELKKLGFESEYLLVEKQPMQQQHSILLQKNKSLQQI